MQTHRDDRSDRRGLCRHESGSVAQHTAVERFAVITFVLLLSHGTVHCAAASDKEESTAPKTGSDRIVNVGAPLKQGNTTHLGGNVVFSRENPGVAFGLSQRQKDKARFSYFVILKGDYSPETWTTSFAYQTETRNGRLRTDYTTTVNSSTFVITHQCPSDRVPEVITICGKNFQPSKGRVFLVDLTADPPAIEQKQIALPQQDPAQERKKADITSIAEKVLAELAKKDTRVRDFVEQSRPPKLEEKPPEQ